MSEITHTHIADNIRQSVSITVILLMTAVFLLLVASPVYVVAEGDDSDHFKLGQMHYEAGDYDAAINSFSMAVNLSPDNSSYHHWLGKSYGMLAQESSLLTAYSLSRKTRRELERAVELDDHNIDALTDLMEYYRQAPSFLGGGEEKADKIRTRLDELNVNEDNRTGPKAGKS